MTAPAQAVDANAWAAAGGKFRADDAEPCSTDPFGGAWRTLAECGDDWLDTEPPDRPYLLTLHDSGATTGVLPRGRVGLLTAAGGLGKSWLMIMLGLCVAVGKRWLSTFDVAAPGRVLLAFAEEDADEMRRRLHWGAKALSLDAMERRRALDRIVALPLCGRSVALTDFREDRRGWEPSPAGASAIGTLFAQQVLEHLDAADEAWSLVILDPISRFAGPDVEVDNAAATRFVQVLERLSMARGQPTVIGVHHTSKSARKGGDITATAARGASGLTDAVRWVGNLSPVHDAADLIRFTVSKSNYTRIPPQIVLKRLGHGELRRATPEEVASVDRASAESDVRPPGRGRSTSKSSRRRDAADLFDTL